MSAARKTGQLGEPIKVADPVEVSRPDGTSTSHGGGVLVLSQLGTWLIDGKELDVTAGAEPSA